MTHYKSQTTVPWVTLFCAIAFFAIVAIVRAQEPAPQTGGVMPSGPNAQREERLELREGMQEERQELRAENAAERRAVLNEGLQNRFLNLLDNATARIEAAILRLTNVSDRLASRLDKLEAADIEVSVPRATLATAKSQLTTAQTTLAAARAAANAALQSETPRKDFQTAKSTFKTAAEELREAFRLLRQVVAETKIAVTQEGSERGVSGAVTNENADASTTPE